MFLVCRIGFVELENSLDGLGPQMDWTCQDCGPGSLRRRVVSHQLPLFGARQRSRLPRGPEIPNWVWLPHPDGVVTHEVVVVLHEVVLVVYVVEWVLHVLGSVVLDHVVLRHPQRVALLTLVLRPRRKVHNRRR